MPFLDFDLDEFEYDSVLDDSESEYGEPRRYFERFRDFVNMTLLLHEASDLHKFHLSSFDMSEFSYNMFAKSWIRYALKHNPRVLDIDVSIEDSLPLDIFSCTSLVNLSLSACRSRNNTEVINLPCLQRLHLRGISVNQDFVEKLFCGSPMLEILHLDGCCLEFSSINSQSLKYLLGRTYFGQSDCTDKS